MLTKYCIAFYSVLRDCQNKSFQRMIPALASVSPSSQRSSCRAKAADVRSPLFMTSHLSSLLLASFKQTKAQRTHAPNTVLLPSAVLTHQFL